MKRVVCFSLLLSLILPFSACTGGAEDTPLAGVFPDQASQMEAIYFECGNTTTWDLTAEERAALENWALTLDLSEQSFLEGETPGDRDGGSGYTFQLGGKSFSYILAGEADYILLEGVWYFVENPSLPPVTAPGASALAAEDMETLEAYYYIVPADAEKKTVTDGDAIQKVLDLLDQAEETAQLPESITGGDVVSFRLYLGSGEVQEWVCEASASPFWTIYGRGGTTVTAVDCTQIWKDLPGKAAAAQESELPVLP